MKRSLPPSDDSWESDAIWKLLDQAPPAVSSPRFVDDTVRAARLMEQEPPFWKKWFFPVSLGGLAATAAAVVAVTVVFAHHQSTSTSSVAVVEVRSSENYAALEDAAETETLLVAADHLDQFSDTELVSLIGF